MPECHVKVIYKSTVPYSIVPYSTVQRSTGTSMKYDVYGLGIDQDMLAVKRIFMAERFEICIIFLKNHSKKINESK